MQTDFNLEEKLFIRSQLLLLADSVSYDGNRLLIKAIDRMINKFTENSTRIPLKLAELDVILETTTKFEHELSNRILPELQKSVSEEKQEQIARAQSLIDQTSALVLKLEEHIKRAHGFRK